MSDATHTPPPGYPFMNIAKQFDLDYGDVLNLANTFKSATNLETTINTRARLSKKWGMRYREIVDAVSDAFDVQQMVARGKIDWHTGAPL